MIGRAHEIRVEDLRANDAIFGRLPVQPNSTIYCNIDTDVPIWNGILCRRCLDADQLELLIGHVAVKTLLHQVHSGLTSLFALVDLVTLKAPPSQLSQVSFLLVHIVAG